MRDVFPDGAVDGKSAGEYPVSDADAARTRDSLEGQAVCPFCGVVSDGSQPICGKCTMENSAVARKATKLRIGPWYVLQHRNPAAPGMKWETLLTFVRKGRVKPQSIVRGPTTHQLWRFAAHVKGLSREFGVCYSCGGSVDRNANLCSHCNRLQEPPLNPDTLLEGSGEPEARLPIYKEINPQNGDATQGGNGVGTHAAEDEELRKLREEAEAFAREQREAVAREREALDQEKQAAAREREAFRRERETIARDREAVFREKDSVERDRNALARDREALRREREILSAMPSVENSPVLTDAAPIHAPTVEPVADKSVWDLPDHDSPRHNPPPAQGSRTSTTYPTERPPISSPAPAPQKPKAPQRDSFLSAKDLAAAFKLNLSPGTDYDLAVQPNDAGSAVDISMPTEPSAPRRGGRKVLVVLLLGVIALGVLFAVQPDWRQKASKIWSDLSEPAPRPVRPTTAPATPYKDELPDLPNLDPTPVVLPQTRPAPTISDPRPVPTTQLLSAAAVQKEQAQLLYREAKDAEARLDFAQAARLFELIQKLPRNVWPDDDIEGRANLNRIQAKTKQP